MKTKVCRKCKKEKLQKEFHLNRSRRGGCNPHCKTCMEAYKKAYYQANKEKVAAKSKVYREANKEKVAAKSKVYREANKEKIAAKDKAYRKANKEKIAARIKVWREANKEKILAKEKAYRKANREKLNARRRLYVKNRAKKDPVFRLRHTCKTRMQAAFKRKEFKKKSKTADMLGCDWDFLKSHIESQFKDGMSWENREKWHIDHIIPLASASSEDDVIKLSHFSNLQPLWAGENLKKADKIIECQPELTLKH